MMPSLIIAADPGNKETGLVLYDPIDHCLRGHSIVQNETVRRMLKRYAADHEDALFATEMIASYGMAVGAEVFDTCVWIGRFLEIWPHRSIRVYRTEVKMHLCHNAQAKDTNVRQAILDQFPAIGAGKTPQIGNAKKPGPLFGVSSHCWSALGVALTAAAIVKQPKRRVRLT